MNTIIFKEKAYPVKEIKLPKFGTVLIGITELNSLLVNDKGGYTSAEALEIDQQIYYFVEPEELLLPEEKLIRLVMEQCI